MTEAKVRTFTTGATRNLDENKFDYEGFLHPLVITRFGEYMHKHRKQADGKLRDSDNWQKGIPQDSYMKSGYRHFMDWWSEHRGIVSQDGVEDAICALIFNCMGYLLTLLLKRGYRSQKAEQAYGVPGVPGMITGSFPSYG